MQTYYAPTKLFIGDEEKNIGKIIASYGYKHVLFVYGGGSIKRSGLYDIICNSLEENSIEFIEVSGVEPNPKVEFIREVLNKNYDFDLILAVGGGSVIDCAKNIAVSYHSGCDPWDFNSYKVTPKKALPIGVVLTISAAGSEMSSSCVITNKALKIKQGFNSDLVRPLFAIMNPKLTYTVSKYQTACGVVDIMMHTLERFISKEEAGFADDLAIGLLKTVYQNGIIAYNNPENYEARKNIMLASSFSHNGLTNVGRSNLMRVHKFEHIISGHHDEVAHGAGLSVAWPAFAKFIYKNELALPKFLRLSYEVFDIAPTSNKEDDAYLGIIKMMDYFRDLGMPLSLKDLNISEDEIESFALEASGNKTKVINDICPLGYDEILEIFKLMI